MKSSLVKMACSTLLRSVRTHNFLRGGPASTQDLYWLSAVLFRDGLYPLLTRRNWKFSSQVVSIRSPPSEGNQRAGVPRRCRGSAPDWMRP